MSVAAGRDLKGAALRRDQYDVTDWWWRSGARSTTVAWWSRYDLFKQGIATFGGGDIALNAGRDAQQVHASAANSGWRGTAVDDAQAGPTAAYMTGGGSVSLAAGRDVIGGRLFASGSTLEVRAERSISRDATIDPSFEKGLEVLHQATAVQVQSRSNALVASVRSAGMSDSVEANDLGSQVALGGLSDGASLTIVVAAGDLALPNAGTRMPTGKAGSDAVQQLLPESLQLRAPAGNITLGNLNQASTGKASIEVLADGDITLGSLNALAAGPELELGAYARVQLNGAIANGVTAYTRLTRLADEGTSATPQVILPQLDQGDRNPVRVHAANGDLTLTGQLRSARPVDLRAGRDLVFAGLSGATVQHQPQRLDLSGGPQIISEMSVLSAGRDISNVAIDVAGPGDLLVLAGRNIDLGQKNGIVATGGVNNSALLPSVGANLTLVAGLRADGQDYRQAMRQGFHVVNSRDIQSRIGDWVVALGGATDAQAFNSLSSDQRLQWVRQWLGGAEFDAGIAQFVRGLPARSDASEQSARIAALLGVSKDDPGVAKYAASLSGPTVPAWSELTAAQAGQAFAALPQFQRDAALLHLLEAKLASQPDDKRRALVSGFADPQVLESLRAYVARMTGADVAPRQALASFEGLPLERQIPWLNQRLFSELRVAGRAAASQDGDLRWSAYVPAYLAINTLFPLPEAGGRGVGNISLPTSQVKTQQIGDVTLLAPGGGANAGEIVSAGASKSPSRLGIVTVNGGNISAMVAQDFAVNQSRVFTLDRGDLLLFSTAGSIDAGRGAKTVVGAPAPVLRLDANGNLVYDTSGSFSGSGIAVLNAQSNLDLYAPAGDINAGEAGIRSKGNAFLAAERVVNAIDIQVGGKTTGGGKVDAPAPVLSAPPNTTLQSSNTALASSDGDDDKKKRRKRRNLLLEFLGFGSQ